MYCYIIDIFNFFICIIIQVIILEEIINFNVDELSVMIYVFYFFEVKLKFGVFLRLRIYFSVKCFVKGFGVELKGFVVKKLVNFIVFI